MKSQKNGNKKFLCNNLFDEILRTLNSELSKNGVVNTTFEILKFSKTNVTLSDNIPDSIKSDSVIEMLYNPVGTLISKSSVILLKDICLNNDDYLFRIDARLYFDDNLGNQEFDPVQKAYYSDIAIYSLKSSNDTTGETNFKQLDEDINNVVDNGIPHTTNTKSFIDKLSLTQYFENGWSTLYSNKIDKISIHTINIVPKCTNTWYHIQQHNKSNKCRIIKLDDSLYSTIHGALLDDDDFGETECDGYEFDTLDKLYSDVMSKAFGEKIDINDECIEYAERFNNDVDINALHKICSEKYGIDNIENNFEYGVMLLFKMVINYHKNNLHLSQIIRNICEINHSIKEDK